MNRISGGSSDIPSNPPSSRSHITDFAHNIISSSVLSSCPEIIHQKREILKNLEFVPLTRETIHNLYVSEDEIHEMKTIAMEAFALAFFEYQKDKEAFKKREPFDKTAKRLYNLMCDYVSDELGYYNSFEEAAEVLVKSRKWDEFASKLIEEPVVVIFKDFHTRVSQGIKEHPEEFSHHIARANLRLNRYNDMFPYDHNLIFVEGSTYINASPIVVLNRHYIAAQAPRLHTTGHFMKLLIENEIEVIVCLASPGEGAGKMEPYWDDKLHFVDEEFSVTTLSEAVISEKEEQKIIRRELEISRQAAPVRKITQLHYSHWPDFGAPSLFLLSQLIDAAALTQKPILVHCSAGVGRAGTFIAADALSRFQHDPVPVLDTLFCMRLQRPGMVQTASQFKIILDLLEFRKSNLS